MSKKKPMDELKCYLEERSEGVLRLLEGGKRRGLEELKRGKGRGSQKELFQVVASSQRAFMGLHERCRSALRFARDDEAHELALDVQYLLYLFSRQVYDLAFSEKNSPAAVSFPPPEAYSRHYPGEGPQGAEALTLFMRYFGDAVYSREKSSVHLVGAIDQAREDRMVGVLQTFQ